MIGFHRERPVEAGDRILKIADVLRVVIGMVGKTDVLHSLLEAGMRVVHGR